MDKVELVLILKMRSIDYPGMKNPMGFHVNIGSILSLFYSTTFVITLIRLCYINTECTTAMPHFLNDGAYKHSYVVTINKNKDKHGCVTCDFQVHLIYISQVQSACIGV